MPHDVWFVWKAIGFVSTTNRAEKGKTRGSRFVNNYYSHLIHCFLAIRIKRQTADCVDKSDNVRGSDCASLSYLCTNDVYYDVMTEQCPKWVENYINFFEKIPFPQNIPLGHAIDAAGALPGRPAPPHLPPQSPRHLASARTKPDRGARKAIVRLMRTSAPIPSTRTWCASSVPSPAAIVAPWWCRCCPPYMVERIGKFEQKPFFHDFFTFVLFM